MTVISLDWNISVAVTNKFQNSCWIHRTMYGRSHYWCKFIQKARSQILTAWARHTNQLAFSLIKHFLKVFLFYADFMPICPSA